jgi:RecA-family ATPase
MNFSEFVDDCVKGESGKAPRIISSKDFVAGFIPPDYVVDGLLQEGFFYSLTGQTGAGKTAITLRLAASVAMGALFAGRETKKRRVLYLAAENPIDVRMRWIALAQHMRASP